MSVGCSRQSPRTAQLVPPVPEQSCTSDAWYSPTCFIFPETRAGLREGGGRVVFSETVHVTLCFSDQLLE